MPVELVPVEHDPFAVPPGANLMDAFEAAAARTRQSVQPDGGRPEGNLTKFADATGRYLGGIPFALATLPQRAFDASEIARLGEAYHAGPAVEATLLTMGGTGAGAEVGAIGSGPARFSALNTAIYRQRALDRRNQGLPTGQSARGWNVRRPDAEAGTFDRAVQETKANFRNDKSGIAEDYRQSVYPDRYEPIDEGYMVGDYLDALRRSTFGAGPTDKRLGAALASGRNLIAEREAEGQMQLPGLDRVSQAELAQRQADARLQPSVAQKPMDIGLFGDTAGQKSFDLGAGATDPRRAGVLAVGSQASPRVGIRAYHGSPHDFDRFDMSRIGTGEGAQAYGHGLYFAERPAVAETYKLQGLASSQPAVNVASKVIAAGRDPMERLRLVFPQMTDAEMQAAIETARNPPKGRMYEVNINARPEQFLDWDKPLAQQEGVRPTLEAMPVDMFARWQDSKAWPHVTGQNVYDVLGGDRTRGAVAAGQTAQASEVLRDAGIPGIRYLDEGSRGPVPASQQHALRARGLTDIPRTHNYVVFNDGLIDILRKYGLAGLSVLPPATAAALSQRIVPVDHDPFAQLAAPIQ